MLFRLFASFNFSRNDVFPEGLGLRLSTELLSLASVVV